MAFYIPRIKEKSIMFERQETRIPSQVNQIGFAFVMGIGAAVGIGARTGNLSIEVAIGVAVFLILGLFE